MIPSWHPFPCRSFANGKLGGRFLDVQALRVQHHICGVLSGTLPQVGQQNVFLGLPLMLLPEEVVVLVKNSAFLSMRERLNPS